MTRSNPEPENLAHGLVRLNGYPQRELFDGETGQIGLEVYTIIAKKQSVQNDHRVGPVKLTVKYHGVGQEVPLVVIECLINRPPSSVGERV